MEKRRGSGDFDGLRYLPDAQLEVYARDLIENESEGGVDLFGEAGGLHAYFHVANRHLREIVDAGGVGRASDPSGAAVHVAKRDRGVGDGRAGWRR